MRFLPWKIVVLALCLTSLSCNKAPEKKKPVQVILLTVDTLRADRLGCYGYRKSTSPNIDALAADSSLFLNASCNVPSTTPSFQSTLTGLAATEASTNQGRLNPEITTLQEMMKKAGMTTVAVVSNPKVGHTLGFAKGFDRYVEVFDRLVPQKGRNKVEANEINEAVLPILSELKDKSFFLWILYLDPHTPYVRHPQEYYDAPWPQSLHADVGATIKAAQEQSDGVASVWFGDSQFAKDSAIPLANYLYDGEVRFVDDYLGNFIKELKKLKIYDDALLVFAADHGESLLEHDYYGHGDQPFQPGVHVPLAIHWPGKAPTVIKEPVSLMDIMPTVCDWVKTPVETPLRGSVLTPGGRKTSPPILIATLERAAGKHRALREGPHKLVRWVGWDSPKYTLFNVVADPEEEVEISQKEPVLFQKMKTELNQAIDGIGPPALDSRPLELSPQLRKQLKALGYSE